MAEFETWPVTAEAVRVYRAHLRYADVTRLHAEAIARSIGRAAIFAPATVIPVLIANELSGEALWLGIALFAGGVPALLAVRALAARSDLRLAARVVALAESRKRAALEAARGASVAGEATPAAVPAMPTQLP